MLCEGQVYGISILSNFSLLRPSLGLGDIADLSGCRWRALLLHAACGHAPHCSRPCLPPNGYRGMVIRSPASSVPDRQERLHLHQSFSQRHLGSARQQKDSFGASTGSWFHVHDLLPIKLSDRQSPSFAPLSNLEEEVTRSPPVFPGVAALAT